MASLTGSQGLAVGFVSGAAAALLLVAALSFLFMRTSDVYGLGHWKLNVRTPLPSMWMNVGYWYGIIYIHPPVYWFPVTTIPQTN